MPKLFFEESKIFSERVAQLFSFVHPASVAMWNLRWQVQGFVDAVPDVTDSQLSDRFSSGSDIRANNLREILVNTPWEEQLSQFAQVVTSNLIALYEGWAEELTKNAGFAAGKKKIQFPSRGTFGNSRSDGVGEVIASAHSLGTSVDLEAGLYPAYAASAKYSRTSLDALLALYRYHKEIRNSLMHRGGIADENAEKAWREVSNLSRSDIGGKSAPLLTPISEGAYVSSSMRESIQLGDVLIRIVSTVDAELSYTSHAESYFVARWRSNPSLAATTELPGDESRRHRRIVGLCKKIGFEAPVDSRAIVNLASRHNLVR